MSIADDSYERRMRIAEHCRQGVFVVIVDINQFTKMVVLSENSDESIAQFVKDTLHDAIAEIEKAGGEVVAFMGDAVLGVLLDGPSAVEACFGIARASNRRSEYLSHLQAEDPDAWEFAPGGTTLKIAVEYGALDLSTISSRFHGEHDLLIGMAVNYAARISAAGEGNRCVVGPKAARLAFHRYPLEGPFAIEGKRGEGVYEYYVFSMDDAWVEGPRQPGGETHLH